MLPQDLEAGRVENLPAAPTPADEQAEEPSKPSKGFVAVAAKITSDPDKSTTIYRRFDSLSAQNLLFYQAELAELEELRKRYDTEDQKARDDVSMECQRDWESFARRANDGGREKRKMKLAMKIRRLEKYRKSYCHREYQIK